MTTNNVEERFDYLLGRITALEVTLAGLLTSAPEHQWKMAFAYMELALAGGLYSTASEHFMKGYQATQSKFSSLNREME